MTNIKKLENYVIMKRELQSDYLNRKISRDEFFLITWIRLSANPYGVAIVNMKTFSDDLFNSKKNVNQINKMMINLKNQRYLYYKNRSGSRGSFRVNLPDFIIPKSGVITNIDKLYEDDKSRGLDTISSKVISEPTQSLHNEKQRSDDIKDVVNSMALIYSVRNESRGHNTYNNKDIDNDKNRLSLTKKKRNTNTQLFQPNSLEEAECKDFALYIDEEDMSYILSILDRYPYTILENAIEEFHQRNIDEIEDLPAYFNSIVQSKLVEFGYNTEAISNDLGNQIF